MENICLVFILDLSSFITALATSYLPTLTTETAYHMMIFFNLLSTTAEPRSLLAIVSPHSLFQ